MRTTLAIDDDVLQAAKELGRLQGKTLGEMVSELARQALRPAPSRQRRRNGVPLLRVRPGAGRVTSELVRALNEELP